MAPEEVVGLMMKGVPTRSFDSIPSHYRDRLTCQIELATSSMNYWRVTTGETQVNGLLPGRSAGVGLGFLRRSGDGANQAVARERR